MIRFSPLWITSETGYLDTSPVIEGNVFATMIVATDTASVSVPSGPTISLNFITNPGSISSVKIDDQVVSPSNITLVGPLMTIDTTGITMTPTVNILITRTSSPVYSLLTGNLPPGMTIASNGSISGMLLNLPDGVTSYTFVIRASNGQYVKDRAFTIRTSPLPRFQTIDSNTIPASSIDPVGLFEYHPLGSFSRADGFLKTIGVMNSIGGEQLSLFPSGATGVPFTEGLPPGITLTGTILQGTISPSAPSGRYLFGLDLIENTTGSHVICEIVVKNALSGTIGIPVIVNWITPSGSIGTIREGEASFLKIESADVGVNYSLAPNSHSLPNGMMIDSSTGDLVGVAPHVFRDTEFSFTLRAFRAGNYTDREFSFSVINRYTTSNTLDIKLKMMNTDYAHMSARIQAAVVPSSVYRPTDTSFGIVEPFVYMIKGINTGSLETSIHGTDINAITPNTDYHSTIELVMGEHAYAVAKDDMGNIVYEVIYRKLYDPQAKTGGFSYVSDQVTEKKVIHAQSNKDIYPISLRNARLDLIKDHGFPTTNASLQYVESMETENLPRWMASKQADGTIPGFTPALVFAYTKPGTAEAIVQALNVDTLLPHVGEKIVFSRYFLTGSSSVSMTAFDSGTTTFDGFRIFDLGAALSETSVPL